MKNFKEINQHVDDVFDSINWMHISLSIHHNWRETQCSSILVNVVSFTIWMCISKPFIFYFWSNSIQYILSQIDNCIQYGEDADVKIKDFDPDDDWSSGKTFRLNPINQKKVYDNCCISNSDWQFASTLWTICVTVYVCWSLVRFLVEFKTFKVKNDIYLTFSSWILIRLTNYLF